MQTVFPLVRDLVLVGGGHTHALVLRKWGMSPVPGIRLSVIDPGPTAAYSGMLPGAIAGHYDQEELEIDLVRLARHAGARLITSAATGIDPDSRTIFLSNRSPVHYDLASIDIGITARMPDLPGFAEYAIPAKPLGPFATRWDAFVRAASTERVTPRVVVLGGGVAGVELALTMHHRLNKTCGDAEVCVIDRGAALNGLAGRSRQVLLERLTRAGIVLREFTELLEITADAVQLADGDRIGADLIVGAAGATPMPWLAETGLHLTDGFITVDAALRSTSHPTVFAAGDCAHLSSNPRPKAGVFAVRAAPVLNDNLRAALSDRLVRPFRPQRSYLKLITLGPKEALGQKGPLTLSGPMMWRLKDYIDRAFMHKLNDLPAMTQSAPPGNAPPALTATFPSDRPFCGGCGAKVGAGALSAALATLPAQTAEGLETRPGDDAAVLRTGDGWQVISTDHLRAVTEDPQMMARIALIHAMGDVWAMGARPQLALAQIVLPRMSATLQTRTLTEITAATAEITTALGAALAGGHTTMGAEMTIGFTVTGLSDTPPITKGGAEPGHVLLLTRPIGSGTLLSAEMQGRARGAWITALLDMMTTPQDREAAELADRACAMTDVTGFGLAGHALEMAQASGVEIELTLSDMPLHDGAADLSAQGLRSSIYEDNRAACLPLMQITPHSPLEPLLFDPQTCGGLLVAMPPQTAMEAVARIAAVGGRVWTVGRVLDGPVGLRIV